MKLTKMMTITSIVCASKIVFLMVGIMLYSPATEKNITQNMLNIRATVAFAKENTPTKTTAPSAINPLEKERLLLEKERTLAQKEQDLQALEATVNASLQELDVAQKRLTLLIQELKGEQDKQLQHLIDVYSNMKPQQAGMVLETLDETIAVKILSGMKGRKAGEVLSFVEPKKAASLSERLTQIQLNSAVKR